MKLKNREMINMQNVLTSIGSKQIDPVLGVDIARNNFNLMTMTKPVLDEKEKLLDKYGKKDEAGKLITDNEGNVTLADPKKYNSEYNRLMDAEGEIELISFTMNDIKKMDPTPNQIMHLLPIIVQKEKK